MEILQDFSVPEINAAIEDNLEAFVCFCARASGGEVHEDSSLTWAMNGAPVPFLNGVLRARLTPETLDQAVETTLELFAERHQPMFWRVGPAARPNELSGALLAHGLKAELSPGMAVDLQSLNENRPAPADLVIEQVTERSATREWLQPFGAAFEEKAAQVYPDTFASWLLGDHPGAAAYLARLEGKPVATSYLFPAVGVAGIYAVATDPKAPQRQGIGGAVVLSALREARRQGYRIAILHSSAQGFNLYRQLGFRQYCTLMEFEWWPKQSA